jgi:LPXTG-motif cell wall-anchored protein
MHGSRVLVIAAVTTITWAGTTAGALAGDVPAPSGTPVPGSRVEMSETLTVLQTQGTATPDLGGVDVDQADARAAKKAARPHAVHQQVAPEQWQVSRPAAVKAAPLPKTGADSALTTMLGLALVAGGAIVYRTARD